MTIATNLHITVRIVNALNIFTESILIASTHKNLQLLGDFVPHTWALLGDTIPQTTCESVLLHNLSMSL